MNLAHYIEPSVSVQSTNIDTGRIPSQPKQRHSGSRYDRDNSTWITALALATFPGLPARASIRCSSEEKEKSSRWYGLFHGVRIDGLRRIHGKGYVEKHRSLPARVFSTRLLILYNVKKKVAETSLYLKPLD